MASITKILLKRIAADLAEHPLETGEIRRIAGMGGHYISLEPFAGGRKPLFSLEIDGQACHIHYAPARSIDADGV